MSDNIAQVLRDMSEFTHEDFALLKLAADRIDDLDTKVSELSQDVINWRVAMGSWVWEAVEECEKALADKRTDKAARRWYQDALTAANALAKKYNIPKPISQKESK